MFHYFAHDQSCWNVLSKEHFQNLSQVQWLNGFSLYFLCIYLRLSLYTYAKADQWLWAKPQYKEAVVKHINQNLHLSYRRCNQTSSFNSTSTSMCDFFLSDTRIHGSIFQLNYRVLPSSFFLNSVSFFSFLSFTQCTPLLRLAFLQVNQQKVHLATSFIISPSMAQW